MQRDSQLGCGEDEMKQVKLCFDLDNDKWVNLSFYWSEEESCWICKMCKEFMDELGPLPVEDNSEL